MAQNITYTFLQGLSPTIVDVRKPSSPAKYDLRTCKELYSRNSKTVNYIFYWQWHSDFEIVPLYHLLR